MKTKKKRRLASLRRQRRQEPRCPLQLLPPPRGPWRGPASPPCAPRWRLRRRRRVLLSSLRGGRQPAGRQQQEPPFSRHERRRPPARRPPSSPACGEGRRLRLRRRRPCFAPELRAEPFEGRRRRRREEPRVAWQRRLPGLRLGEQSLSSSLSLFRSPVPSLLPSTPPPRHRRRRPALPRRPTLGPVPRGSAAPWPEQRGRGPARRPRPGQRRGSLMTWMLDWSDCSTIWFCVAASGGEKREIFVEAREKKKITLHFFQVFSPRNIVVLLSLPPLSQSKRLVLVT